LYQEVTSEIARSTSTAPISVQRTKSEKVPGSLFVGFRYIQIYFLIEQDRNKMREIVHLQAGQCGNQIGAKVKI
jgi:hypothetical protein